MTGYNSASVIKNPRYVPLSPAPLIDRHLFICIKQCAYIGMNEKEIYSHMQEKIHTYVLQGGGCWIYTVFTSITPRGIDSWVTASDLNQKILPCFRTNHLQEDRNPDVVMKKTDNTVILCMVQIQTSKASTGSITRKPCMFSSPSPP